MAVLRLPGFGFKGKKISIGAQQGGGSGGLSPTPFRPGHFLAPALSMSQTAPFHTNGVIRPGSGGLVVANNTILNTELPAHPVIIGVKHRYYWNQFENITPGSYDFDTLLGTHLTELGSRGKYMQVLIALTIPRGNDWTTYPSIAPRYMVTGSSTGVGTDGVAYQGGQWGFGSQVGGAGGFRIRVANENVSQKFNAMLSAMCTYLKNHEYFEYLDAICFSESAIGNAVAPYSSPGAQETFDALIGAADVVQAAIPNRHVYLSVNHPIANPNNSPNDNIEYLLTKMQANGRKYGFGTPNICPGDEALNAAPNANGYLEGPLHKIPTYTGCRIPEIQPADFYWSQIQYNHTDYPYAPTYTFGGDYIPTMQQLWNKAISLNAHQVVWTRDTTTNPQTGVQYHTAMYNFLDTKAALANGGLVGTRPAIYPT